ncbi:hypothetical protein VPHK459_0099 [Vibrio phage K459]
MKTLKDIKNLVGLDSHHNYGDIFKAVMAILVERDMLRAERKILASPTLARYDEMQGTINGLKQLLELPESAGLTELFNAVEALELNKSERDTLRKEYNSNVKDWRELCGYFNLPVSTLSDVLSEIDTIRKERDDLKRTTILEERDELQGTINHLEQLLELNKPQLSEIRYVLHGDIQPCSVLYSDDTTTLLRLDEGDMMLETDTIEWSDSVTYRCQELLRASQGKQHVSVAMVKAVAQLVRDERILLNDNGDDETSGTVDLKMDSDIGVGQPVVQVPTAVVPAPPPFGHEKPDHNNPYVHTTTLFTEEAMRKHGWTSEALVSCGHGHYAPMQRPADSSDIPFMRHSPVQER